MALDLLPQARNRLRFKKSRLLNIVSIGGNSLAMVFLFLGMFFLQQRDVVASQQTKASVGMAKADSKDEPGAARFIRDENGVSILEFAGDYDIGLHKPRQTIAKEFYRTHADVYDFLVVFSSFEFPTGTLEEGDALAFYNPIRNDTKGIGRDLMDNSALYGSESVLQGYLDMAAATRWLHSTSSSNYDELLSTFAHELQHRWGSFVKFRDWDGKISEALLGKDGDHWSYLLDTNGSVMYGAAWRDNGDGTFTATDTRSTYSPLDLYLAGLIDKTKVPPFTLIEAPGVDSKALPAPVGTTIRATKRTVTVDDVIAAEGPRIPSADKSQKSFRFGFIYLTRPGEVVDPELLKVVTQARRQVGLRYNALTLGMGTANVFSEPPLTTSPGTPSTTLPSTGSPSPSPGNHAAGLSWLKSQQKADGSFMDATGLAPRDTILAKGYFLATEPVYSGIAAASGWIANAALNNTDFLARKLIESSAGERNASDASLLLSARNSDGGWGLGEGLRSNPLDTSLAVQALRLSNSNQTVIQQATELLHGWQNKDGGWGNAPGSPSRVQTTSQVLKALTGLSDSTSVVKEAKNYIKGKQSVDGGFGDQNSSVHDTANATLAMLQGGFGAEIDFSAAQKYVAEAQRLDGSWQGSVYSTVLALQMLNTSSSVNLSIGSLQVSPQPVVDGQRVKLTARVSNTSATQSPITSVRFYDLDPNSGGSAIGAAIAIPALVGGDSIVVSAVWDTTARAGQRVVFAVVDPEQITGDLNRQDNITSLNITVEGASALADVLLADGDVLATPSLVSALPAVVQIDALISNAGLAGVTNAKAVLWAVSGDVRKKLAETSFDVGPRATTSVQFKPTLSEGGVTTYTVELDPEGVLKESSRSNNSASVTVKTTGGVSLAVKTPDITLNPATPKPGSDAVFSVRLHNNGTLDSTSFNVRYSIRSESGTTTILTNVVQIAAGSSVDQSIPWRVGKGGSYSFTVAMDPENLSGDSNTEDNVASLDFSVSETAGLNLAVSYKDMVFTPSPGLEGVNLALSAQVRNVGDVASTGFNVWFYDGDPKAGGAALGSTSVAALAAGASATATIDWLVTSATGRLIFVVVDPEYSQVGESSLEDNTAFSELKVLSLPDLAVSSGALTLSPSIPRPGHPTVLTVKVSNFGEQAASGVVVSAFNGDQNSGTKLASDIVIPTIASKATESVQFSFTAPAVAGVSTISVVVNPQFLINERVRDNNIASLSLGTQEGNFSVSEAFISPDGDGVKDSTVLSFRLPRAMAVGIQVMDEQGSVVRSASLQAADSSGAWQWDGLDSDGRLVQDGRYELTVRNAEGVVIGGATVEVDTNRSSLLAAIGKAAGINAGLTCTTTSAISTAMSIRDGSGFYFSAPTARDGSLDLQAGIYRIDEWGRNLRLVLGGQLSANSAVQEPWTFYVFNDQGTRLVAYHAGRKQLVSAGGEGESKKVIFNQGIRELIGLSNDANEVFVLLMDGGLVAINTSTGAQRSLGLSNASDIRLSPDGKRMIAEGETGPVWLNTVTGQSKELQPNSEYEWSPRGVFLIGKSEKMLSVLDTDGNPYSEINTENQYGKEAWSEDALELYLPVSSKCILAKDEKSLQCSGTVYRVDVSSGERSAIKSLSITLNEEEMIGFEGNYEDVRLVADLLTVPGRYELLAELQTQRGQSPGTRLSSSKAASIAQIKSEDDAPVTSYSLIDLRSNKVSSLEMGDAPPHVAIIDSYYSDRLSHFIEYGRALAYRSSTNPAQLPACVEKSNSGDLAAYVFRTRDNLQTDLVLSRVADGVSVKIHGGVADKNFSRYWLDYASEDAPESWRPITAASTVATWDKDLAVWVAPGIGRYTVRLTAEDLAGNQKQKLRRITLAQAGPPITNIVREPAFISPNGDGSNDEMKLSYRVLEPVNLEFSIFNQQGALVRSLSRNHPAGAVDAAIVWDGRDNNGQVVADGEYRINVVGFDFFVNVDNTAPVIKTLRSGPPFACANSPCRSTELRWDVSDTNFESVQIEVGDGSMPAKWRPYGRPQQVRQNLDGDGAIYLPLANYVGQRYRLTAIDSAGNRTVAQFAPAQADTRLMLAGQILSRDLEAGAVTPAPTSATVLQRPGDLLKLRPAAGIAMVFAESLDDPVVAVSVQFNETALANQGDWLEQPNVQVYPVDGLSIPYLLKSKPDARVADRSAFDDENPMPQHYGMVGFFNANISAYKGVSLRLKLTGRSGVHYLTNEVKVQDYIKAEFKLEASVTSALLQGQVSLATDQVVQKLEVFVSSQDDPYFAIERRILNQALGSMVPEKSAFSFTREGRYVSCATYKVRALVTMAEGAVLQKETSLSDCGGVELKVRPDFAMCGDSAPHRLHGFVTPKTTKDNVPLLALEVYANYPDGSSELIFNVVNPEYKAYEFSFDHSRLAEGNATLIGTTTDRDGVRREGILNVPVDHTPANLRITYPLENQKVCAIPEWHKRAGTADILVNALRPVVEVEDGAGFDYLQEFRVGEDDGEEGVWQSVSANLPSLMTPDPRGGVFAGTPLMPYTLNEYYSPAAGRPYMTGKRIAGELGPIFNISGQVTTRVRVYDWSGAQVCRQVSFYLDGAVEVGAASVDRRLFAPGTSSSLDSVGISINPLEPVNVTVLVRRVVTDGGLRKLEAGGVRKLLSNLAVQAGQHNLVWDGKDDAGRYVADGEYTFDIQYEDGCGNLKAPNPEGDIDAARLSLLVQVDRTPPVLQIERPLAGEVTSAFLDIAGSVNDKNLQQWMLEYSLDSNYWAAIASGTQGIDLRKLATLNATGMEGAITLRLRATDRAELSSEVSRVLQLKPRVELIKRFDVSPNPFSPNGDSKRDSLSISYDVFKTALIDLNIKRGGVVVKKLLSQSLAVPGERVVVWDGRNDVSMQAPDGDYSVEFRAVSRSDETNSQIESSMVLLDTAAPVFNLDPPLRAFMPGNAALMGSISDLSLNGYQAYIEGPLPSGKRVLLAEGSEVFANSLLGTLNQLGLDDARYRIRVLATDDADNASDFQSSDFEMDSKAPVVSFSNPVPGTFFSAARPVDISGVLQDQNLLSAELQINNNRVYAGASAAPSAVLTFPYDGTDLPDGDYAMQLIGTDQAGNVGLANSSISVDNTAPVALITSPVAQAAVGTSVPVLGTASDANIESWTLELGSGVGQELQNLTVIGRGVDNIVAGQMTKLVGLPPDGPATLRLTVVDKAGNTSVFNVPLQIDATPPDAPVLSGLREQRNDVRLRWTSKTTTERVASYNLYRNNTQINVAPILDMEYLDAALLDGSYAYSVSAVSHSGVESPRSNIVNMTISASGPIAQINKPVANASVGGLVSIEGSAYAVKNFRAYQVSVGAGAAPGTWTELRASSLPVQGEVLATWSTASLPEAALYTIRLIATDVDGGVSEAQVSVRIDNLPPAKPLGLTAQLSGSNDVSLTWTANVEPDLAGYLLYRDGQLVNQIDPSDNSVSPYLLSSTSYLDKARPDGTFVYTLVAVDGASNQSMPSNPASVLVDNRAPQAVIVQPTDSAAVDGVVYVLASSADTDIATVRFEFKPISETAWSLIAGASAKAPYSVNWNTQGLAEGSYHLRAVATDLAGHTDPAPAAITVLRKNLQRPMSPTQLTALVDGGKVNLSWTASASQGVKGYHVHRMDAQGSVVRLTTAVVVGTAFVDLNLPDARYQYQVVTVNDGDNESDPSAPAGVLVYSTLLKQPYTPVARDSTALQGQSPNVADAVLVTVGHEDGGEQTQTLAPNAQGEFAADTAPLAMGANTITAVQADALGNRSKAGKARVARGDAPLPPASIQAIAAGEVFQTSWPASASLDVIGYVTQLDEAYAAQPFAFANATASSSIGSYANAYRAIDAYDYTAWQPEATDEHPYLELEADHKELVAELSIIWTPYSWPTPPASFVVEAWDGYVWVPLKEETANVERSLNLALDPPYYTDRIRISLDKTSDPDTTLQVADVRGKSLEVIAATQADVPATNGVHTVSVRALSSIGLLGAPASANPEGIGDTTAPPPVVLDASVSGALVTLTWTESIASDLDKYEILRDGQVIANVGAGEPRLYVDGPLVNNRYVYTVRPLDLVGNVGLLSNEAQAFIESMLPDAPVQLTLSVPADGHALRLDWQAPSTGATVAGYVVYRAETPGGPYTLLDGVMGETLAYSDLSVDGGVRYYYIVRAYDALENESAPSNEVSGVAVDSAAPVPPVIFYPTDIQHPITTDQSSTAVHMFSEAGAQLTLYKEGAVAASTKALDKLVVSSLASSIQAFEPAQHGDLAAVMANGRLTIGRLSIALDGSTRSATLQSVSDLGYATIPTWSPDASQVALTYGYESTRLVRVADGSLSSSAFEEPIYALVWHPNGARWIAVTNDRKDLVDIEIDTGSSQLLGTAESEYHRLALSPNGQNLAVVDGNKLVIRSLVDGQSRRMDEPSVDSNGPLIWEHDGQSVYFLGLDVISGLRQVLRLRMGESAPVAATNHYTHVNQFSLSAFGALAFVSDAELYVQRGFGQIPTLVDAETDISRIEWSKSGALLASGNMSFKSLLIPGIGIFPPVQLKVGENLFAGRATDTSGNVGPTSAPISVTYGTGQSGKPDFSLQATDVSVLPLVPQKGMPARITVVANNVGTVTAAGATIRMVAIAPDGTQRELLSSRTREMAAGGSETFRADTIFNSAGNWQLSVAVDTADEVDELSEDNNVVVVPVRVVEGGSARTASVLVQDPQYQVGATLHGSVTLFNGQADIAGQLKISIEDTQGYTVATLPSQSLTLLAYGQSRTADFSWAVPAIFDASYVVRAQWMQGAEQIAQSVANFNVVPRVQVEAKIASDSSTYPSGATAVLIAQVNPAGTSPTTSTAEAVIRVLRPDGSVVLETRDAVSLLSASQLTKSVDTAALVPGTYTAQMQVLYGNQQVASSSAFFEVVSPDAPAASLVGDVVLERSALPYTSSIAGTAVIRNAGKAAASNFQYEVVVIDPRSNAVLARFAQDAASLAVGEELRSNFSFSAAGMPIGGLWVQLRSTIFAKNLPLVSSLYPGLLKQRDVSLFELDPPSVTINQPVEGAYLRSAQSVLAAATDLMSGVRSVEFQMDGGEWIRMTLSDPVSSNYAGVLPRLIDDAHRVSVRATDNSGNSSLPVERSFVVDSLAPVIAINGVTETSYTAVVSPSVVVTDLHLSVVQIQLNGQPYVSGTAISQPGAYVLQVDALDLAGNTASKTVRFTINQGAADTEPPVIDVKTPVEGAYFRRGATGLSALIVDAQSDVVSAEFSVDGGAFEPMAMDVGHGTANLYTASLDALADGPHAIVVRASDAHSNLASAAARNFIVDNTAPVVTISGVSAGQYSVAVSPVITVADLALASSTITLNGNPFASGTSVDANGDYTLTVIASDRAGNVTSTSLQFSIRLPVPDTTAPAVFVEEPIELAHVRRGAMLMVSATDTGSGVAFVETKLDGGTEWGRMDLSVSTGKYTADVGNLQDGVHNASVRASDNAGNVSDVLVRQFTVDNTAPSVSVSGVVQDGQYTGSVSPVISISDAHLSTSSVLLNGNVFVSGSAIATPGIYTLIAAGRDIAGNETIVSIRFEVRAGEGNEPAVTILKPALNALVKSGFLLEVRGAPVSDISRMEMAVKDGEAFVAMQSLGNGLYSASVTDLPDGPLTVRVRAVGIRGDVYSVVTRQVTIDNTPPVIEMLSVQDGESYPFNHAVSFLVTDLHLQSVSSTLNGLPFNAGQRVSTLGRHELSIHALDWAGNAAQQTIVFTIVAAPLQDPVPVPVWPMNKLFLLSLSMLMAWMARNTYTKTRKK